MCGAALVKSALLLAECRELAARIAERFGGVRKIVPVEAHFSVGGVGAR